MTVRKQTAPIIILTGPTASGKTAVSVQLARMLDAEIISADSRQVYRGCDIGTAKPTVEEREGIPHHGIDIRDAGDDYSAGKFHEDAQRWIKDIRSRGKRVLVTGGTGLYVKMIECGIFAAPAVDAALRSRLEQRAAEEGLATLVKELFALDPGARLLSTRAIPYASSAPSRCVCSAASRIRAIASNTCPSAVTRPWASCSRWITRNCDDASM